MDIKDEQILTELEPLFKTAEANNLWFYSPRHDNWFSPSELKEQHKQGKYMWGTPNWELRDPQEKVTALKSIVKNTEDAIQTWERKIAKEKLLYQVD